MINHAGLASAMMLTKLSHCSTSPKPAPLPRTTMRFSISLLFAGLLAGVSASNVLELDSNNFDSVIGQGKPGLVEL